MVVAQGSTYSAQGLFDPFWEPKRNGATPADFRVFNGPTALLLKTDTETRIATSGETITAAFWIAHYGETRLENAKLKWTLSSNGGALAQGECEGGNIELGSTRQLANVSVVIPDVTRPVHATLEAQLTQTGGTIANAWDCWLFPKRARTDGAGIAVDPALLPLLEKRYEKLAVAGTPGAAQADLVIAQSPSSEVGAALADGKRVLLIQGTSGKPNVSLGWWWMGNQVGTAFAKHAAFGDFPHDGTLSPLWSRLLKQGKPLPLAGLHPDDALAVGEGLDRFFLYAGGATCGSGRVLMTFGLDLLSDTPEGACLLDNLVRYARSDAFKPKGAVKTEAKNWNGWQATRTSGDVGRDNLPVGVSQLDVARAMRGKNELVWETQPAPQDVRNKKTYDVTWLGGMGYFAEPPGSFALFMNGEKALDIPAISQTDAEWKDDNTGVRLRYVRDSSTDEYGTFTLTLPSGKATPGKPLTLKAVGSDSNSRRWFGVFETW